MKNNKINILIAKARYLSLELEECVHINEDYKLGFAREIGKIRSKSTSVSQSIKEMNKDIEGGDFSDVSPKKNIDPCIKKLYKKIMTKVHPDKVASIRDDDRRDAYSNMCSRANSAINNFDIYILIDIADKLDIKIDDPSGALRMGLEECCVKYKDDIRMIKSTYVWLWGMSEDELKYKVINEYMQKNF
jgi:hypothetical protein